MQIANARLRLNKVGSDVPLTHITPAEAQLLHVLHQSNNGGSTFGEEFEKITVIGEALVQTGMTEEQVIPAVEAVPAQAAVGEVGKPGYKPAVPAVDAKEEQVIPAKPITRARTDAEEVHRLLRKYGNCVNKTGQKIVKIIWPESSPKLPKTFKEIDWKNINYDGAESAAVNYVTGAPVATK